MHHVEDKDYTIADLVSRAKSVDKLQAELRKCVVLCANCHRIVHAGDQTPPAPGTESTT